MTTHFVLTRHVIAYDVMPIRSKIWDAMKPEQQPSSKPPDKAMDENTERFNRQGRRSARECAKKEGKKVYEPDQNAFRTFAQSAVERQ